MILHCMKKALWEERKNKASWGKRDVERYGYIHCSSIEYFWRVAPNFKNADEDLVLVCIDEKKLASEVRYEDLENCGRKYPHIYGLVQSDAVAAVLPFLRDEAGDYVKNPEFANIVER